jgi:hypothetical protein
VIVCDCDEFLYGIEKLKEFKDNNIKVPHVNGYQMVSDSFPIYDGELITKKIQTGFKDSVFDKQIIFDPNVEIRFGIGAHDFSCNEPTNNSPTGLKLLHYKYLGVDYVHNKNMRSLSRLSNFNKQNGFGDHYQRSFEQTKLSFCDYNKIIEVVL